MQSFGDRLKFLRIYVLKLDRTQFCEQLDFSMVSLKAWENKSTNISKANLLSLQNKLKQKQTNYNQPWLINGIGNPFEIPNPDTGAIDILQIPDFGDRLKFFRRHILNLKRKEFCHNYGFPLLSVQSWENKTSNITIKNINSLKETLDGINIPYNKQWLFEGIGHPFEEDKSTEPPVHENQTPSAAHPMFNQIPSLHKNLTFQINDVRFEPLYPQNTTFELESIHILDLNCPAFIALNDPYDTMHFGIVTETWNKNLTFYAYKSKLYTIVLDEKYKVYRIKSIIFPF